jgi:hypothetical protein
MTAHQSVRKPPATDNGCIATSIKEKLRQEKAIVIRADKGNCIIVVKEEIMMTKFK